MADEEAVVQEAGLRDTSPTDPAGVVDTNTPPEVDESGGAATEEQERQVAAATEDRPGAGEHRGETAGGKREARVSEEGRQGTVPVERFHRVFAEVQQLREKLAQQSRPAERAQAQPDRSEDTYKRFETVFNADPPRAVFDLIRQVSTQTAEGVRGELGQREYQNEVRTVRNALFRDADEAYSDPKYTERVNMLYSLNEERLQDMTPADGAKWILDEYRKRYGTAQRAQPGAENKNPAGVSKAAVTGVGGAAGGSGNTIYQEDVEAEDFADKSPEEARAYMARVDKAIREGRYYNKATGRPVA